MQLKVKYENNSPIQRFALLHLQLNGRVGTTHLVEILGAPGTDIAKIGTEEYGLTVGIHAHAAGFIDFEPELERLLDEVDESILKICFDTGHHSYAGYDPIAFMDRHMDRISYMHFKDIDPLVKADVVANRTGFYKACGQGIFCNLGKGDVDFPAVRQRLIDAGFEGWCTVEQDCDPSVPGTPLEDARANREYLQLIGF